jgi:hypothetical protein
MADIIFTSSGNETADRNVRRNFEPGKLIRVASSIYVELSAEPFEKVVLRNWYMIVAKMVPDGVVADRTGFEGQP